MSPRARSGPDFSAVPNKECPCGYPHKLVKDAGLHARQCQHCWRTGLPCIEWHQRRQRWLCASCRNTLDYPPAPAPADTKQQLALLEGES